MKTFRHLAILLTFLAGSIVPTFAAAADNSDRPAAVNPADDLVPVTAQTDQAWLAQSRADYPLATCVVSEDSFDGPPKEYVYREAGKPDRLVRFCCNDCAMDFRKEPAKYLHALDEASAKKAAKH